MSGSVSGKTFIHDHFYIRTTIEEGGKEKKVLCYNDDSNHETWWQSVKSWFSGLFSDKPTLTYEYIDGEHIPADKAELLVDLCKTNSTAANAFREYTMRDRGHMPPGHRQ